MTSPSSPKESTCHRRTRIPLPMACFALALLAPLIVASGARAGIVANTASLWFNDCMTKSVANKTNFCSALHDYINGGIQGGNPTGRGCTSFMASKGFGDNTPARAMCYWYFTDR